MKESLKTALFAKHILVSDQGENQVETEVALLGKLNIKVVGGHELANPELIRYCARQLGERVPEPFYRGFPRSVLELTPDALLLDQLVHYVRTYGFGNFNEAGHSLFETVAARSPFCEEEPAAEFEIVNTAEAQVRLVDMAESLLASTRPLSDNQLVFVLDTMEEVNWKPESIASKDTACKFIELTKDAYYARFISITDVIKLVDNMSYNNGHSKMNEIKLSNQQRKLVTRVIDILLARIGDNYTNILKACVEKRNVWKGLLHLLHYKPKTARAKEFVNGIFDKHNKSAYSEFEKLVACCDTAGAAELLRENKGNGALIRNLNYLLDRSFRMRDVDGVLNAVEAKSPVVIMQAQNMYRNYNPDNRVFRYTKHGKIHVYPEKDRKHSLSTTLTKYASAVLEAKLMESLRGRAGKVYIAPGMERIAVPTNMSSGQTGYGIMSTGSRIPLSTGKKVRAFVYWEKVNDIDLACIGIREDGEQVEFSWRTMWSRNSEAITYSGDETSGYNGGSEYFDIDVDLLKEELGLKYIVFTANVYSAEPFKNVVCRAGWMSRDILDSGEVYEPKTVKSAYTINADSTFGYLFGIDVDTREVVWLNLTDNRNLRVAGQTEFGWMIPYFSLADTMNMRKLFEYAATKVVYSPEEADLVVGDIETDKPQIRSYEFEKAFEYLK